MTDVTCPHCKQELHVEPQAIVPSDQRFTMSLTCDGPFLSARTLGGSISNMERLLRAIAKNAGWPVQVFVADVARVERTYKVEFIIVTASGPAAPGSENGAELGTAGGTSSAD